MKNRNKQNKQNKQEGKIKSKGIRIIPLIGVQEMGLNSTVLETDEDLILVDAGMGFPNENMYGVDFLMADYSYVYARVKKLKAIILTHGHFDHIGAIPYIIEKMKFPPIYGSRFTIALMRDRLKEFGLHKKVKLIEVRNHDSVRVGRMAINFFHVTHSIPDSCGLMIESNNKRIIFTGDFKFDDTPYVTKVTDYGRIRSLSSQPVNLLISDSTNAFESGKSLSDKDIYDTLENIFKDAQGRIVAATFSSLVNRMQILIDLAEKYRRTVFISGKSMLGTYKIAKHLGYIRHAPNTVKKVDLITNFVDRKILLITTGSQGEDMAGLSKMARGEHREFKIKKGDTFILSSSVIPGHGAIIQRLIDGLIMRGAEVFHQARMDVHTSGHGYKEDQKKMIEIVRPKYFMPAHGFQAFLIEHAKTAEEMGIGKEKIKIPRDGDIFELTENKFQKVDEIKLKPILIDKFGIGDIGSAVLKERDQLANFGIVTTILKIDGKKLELCSKPQIHTRGFVYVKSSGELLKRLENKVEQAFKKWKKSYPGKSGKEKVKKLKLEIEKSLGKFILKETGREPLIIIVVV